MDYVGRRLIKWIVLSELRKVFFTAHLIFTFLNLPYIYIYIYCSFWTVSHLDHANTTNICRCHQYSLHSPVARSEYPGGQLPPPLGGAAWNPIKCTYCYVTHLAFWNTACQTYELPTGLTQDLVIGRENNASAKPHEISDIKSWRIHSMKTHSQRAFVTPDIIEATYWRYSTLRPLHNGKARTRYRYIMIYIYI